MPSLASIRDRTRMATHALKRRPLRELRVRVDQVADMAAQHSDGEAEHLFKLATIASTKLKDAADAVEALHRAAGGQS